MAEKVDVAKGIANLVSQPEQEGPMEGYSAAEPWKRWGAFIIDVFIVYIQSVIVLAFAGACYQIRLNAYCLCSNDYGIIY